ncbi:MAG: ribonuclease E/G, partial [Nostocales cyanobacterium]
ADVNRIVADSSTGLRRVKQYLQNWSGGQTPQGVLIDHHRDRSPILEYFRINAAIREALRPRVDLPSGGYIIIEPTEALTVIDVNSGSFTRSATARETVLWTNCEAATEIARQLRLRNIAGVIVVDFIDMESRRDQLQVLEHFNKALKADKARPQIAQLTELGLVELTRKRQGQNIYELFGEVCSTCGGLGHTVRLPGELEHRMPIPAADIPERFTPVPQREQRMPTTTRISEPREVYDGFGEGFDADGEISPVNLINHPSYQELGDNKRRTRTRRSRIGINGANGKDEMRLGGFPSDSDLDLDGDSDLNSPSESPSLLSDLSERDNTRTSGLIKSGWSEKPERAKLKIEPVKPVVEPPQIISVEMTSQEQDMFALMGISPGVKLESQMRNPKSVIYNIVQPGEEPIDSPELTSEPISEIPKPEVPRVKPIPKTEVEEPSVPKLVLEPFSEDSPNIGFEPVTTEDEANQSSPPNRRRRRRSSASNQDSEDS